MESRRVVEEVWQVWQGRSSHVSYTLKTYCLRQPCVFTVFVYVASEKRPPSVLELERCGNSPGNFYNQGMLVLPSAANCFTPPKCQNMEEVPEAALERTRLHDFLLRSAAGDLQQEEESCMPLAKHLLHGLAYTVGSALGYDPPTREECLAAFVMPNRVGLTAGARAWSKHGHRSQGRASPGDNAEVRAADATRSRGWWGTPSGPVARINEKALLLFEKVVDNATWRNLHWLPHQVLIYEARVEEGYGMRWSQDRNLGVEDTTAHDPQRTFPWVFRGFVEPMMENGHEVGWRH